MMTPGTVIEWRYVSSARRVRGGTMMLVDFGPDVLIGGFHLLIGFVDDVMTWMPLGRAKLYQVRIATQRLVYPCEAVMLMGHT